MDANRGDSDIGPIVYVVDDDLPMRTALKDLIESAGIYCEVFSSPAEYARARHSERPSCLVLNVRSSEMSSCASQAALARRQPHTPIIAMSASADIRTAVEAIKAGAVDFFSKPYREQDMLEAVQRALLRAHGSRQAATKMRDLLGRYDSLTPRERQVMQLICDGVMGKQIAHTLGIAEITVKMHRKNMLEKLGARSVPALVRMADAIKSSAGRQSLFAGGVKEQSAMPVQKHIENTKSSARVPDAVTATKAASQKPSRRFVATVVEKSKREYRMRVEQLLRRKRRVTRSREAARRSSE